MKSPLELLYNWDFTPNLFLKLSLITLGSKGTDGIVVWRNIRRKKLFVVGRWWWWGWLKRPLKCVVDSANRFVKITPSDVTRLLTFNYESVVSVHCNNYQFKVNLEGCISRSNLVFLPRFNTTSLRVQRTFLFMPTKNENTAFHSSNIVSWEIAVGIDGYTWIFSRLKKKCTLDFFTNFLNFESPDFWFTLDQYTARDKRFASYDVL